MCSTHIQRLVAVSLCYQEGIVMVKFIVGEKGTGKSKKLVALANETAKTTEGSLVFIDDNRVPSLSLDKSIRLVVSSGYNISNYQEFLGFICGILSQNNDIVEIFIDGLGNIIKNISDVDLINFANKLTTTSKENNVNFIITINKSHDAFPPELSSMFYTK